MLLILLSSREAKCVISTAGIDRREKWEGLRLSGKVSPALRLLALWRPNGTELAVLVLLVTWPPLSYSNRGTLNPRTHTEEIKESSKSSPQETAGILTSIHWHTRLGLDYIFACAFNLSSM